MCSHESFLSGGVPLPEPVLTFPGRREGETVVIGSDGSMRLEVASGGPPKGGCFGTKGIPSRVAANNIVGATFMEPSSFQVWFYEQRKTKGMPTMRLRKTPSIECESSAQAKGAVEVLRNLAAWGGTGHGRRITCIINPAAGKGSSVAAFSKRVRPVLEAAGHKITVHITSRGGEATEIASRLTPAGCDMAVVCGGDGSLHEVLQGLLSREDWEEGARVPLCPVPTGSGNGLCHSLGMPNLDTAAYAAAKGRLVPLDITSVLQPPHRCYSFLSLTFAMASNVDLGTEGLRWMGDARFTIGAIREILGKKASNAKVVFFPAGVATPPPGSDPTRNLTSQVPGGPPCPNLDSLATDGSSGDSSLTSVTSPLPVGWQKCVRDDFMLFCVLNAKYMAPDFPIGTNVKPSDGCLEFVYSHSLSRAKSLDLLLKAEKSEHLKVEGCKSEMVKALVLDPGEENTWIMVDGEVKEFAPVFLEVHPGLCSVASPVLGYMLCM